MHQRSVLALVLVFVLSAATAAGAEEPRRIQPVVTIGALEVLTFDHGHDGLYASAAGGALFPIGQYASLIPTLGAEWAPENGHWGAVATLTFDQPLAEWIGADLNLILGEDHSGNDFSNALLFAGIGLGPSFYFGSFVLSPSANWFPGPGGGAIVPSLFGSYAF